MPPSTIKVRFSPWWIGGGLAVHVLLATGSGVYIYLEDGPWLLGPMVFGLLGTINTFLMATGVHPYLRVTYRRVSHLNVFMGYRAHVDLSPGDIVIATHDGLYRQSRFGEWERLGVHRALCDPNDWRDLQYWTGGLASRPARSQSSMPPPPPPPPAS